MQIDADKGRRRSGAGRLTLEDMVRGVRDDRRIQQPAEIPSEFLTGSRRFVSASVDRPSTGGTHQSRRQLSSAQHGVLYTGSCSSYFPKIQESYVSREDREPKTLIRTSRTRPMTSLEETLTKRPFPTARGRFRSDSTNDSAKVFAAYTDEDHTSIVQRLDCDGIEAIHHAFQELGRMDEKEFITEMMASLKAERERGDNRVRMAGQLSELFRRVDLHARGEVTWNDFSELISQTTDVASALEDTAINKYHGDLTPSPLNFVAEIDGLIYLPEADQMVIHDARGKGFQLYDPATHRVRTATMPKASQGAIVDAIYAHHGRHIITASTSPVLSFYDLERLHVRQQIPTHCYQTTLAIDSTSTSSSILYSAGSDGDVHAWDVTSLSHRHAFFGRHEKLCQSASITDLEVLPACALLACASMDGRIYMLDPVGGKVVHTMSGHPNGVSVIRYCAENKYLVSGGLDRNLQVWNPHLDKKVGSLPGHRHPLIGLYVRPDSPEVITADSSGVMKIWDLRKFAAVQTIIRELYVKDHNSTAGRPMTAMCYIESRQRVAIAHSSIFFLDPVRMESSDGQPSSSMNDADSSDANEAKPEAEKEEDSKPLHVSFNTRSRSFIAITRRNIELWDAATGIHMRSMPIPLDVVVTSVAMMQDGYSCFVGCENGSVARLMLPSATVLVHKRLHNSGVVCSIRLLDHDRLLFTSGLDGNVVISRWETLEPKYILNHWRALQSVRDFRSLRLRNVESPPEHLSEVYSVPLSLRSFFIGNEIARLTHAFAQADSTRCGKISLSSLPSVLERAFPPSLMFRDSQPTCASPGDLPTLTFATFMDVVKDTLSRTTAEGGGLSVAGMAAFDVHPTLGTLVTTSSTGAEFCVWNVKNAAVMGDGRINSYEPIDQVENVTANASQRQAIAIVRYLHPLPFFLCVEDNSSRLTIWSSLAILPLTALPNMCILRYSHSHTTGTESTARRTTFLTEPKTATKSCTTNTNTNDAVTIRAVDWFFSEQDEKLLCVGDDAGHIQMLDLTPLLRRIDEITKHRSLSAVDQNRDDLPATLLQKVHRWSTSQSDDVGVRSVTIQNTEHLMQPDANQHLVIISVDDLGIVALWSCDGQLLGRLQDENMSSGSRSVWKLHLNECEWKQKTRASAVTMLRQVEQRQSVSMNQQEATGRLESHTVQKPTRVRLLSTDQLLSNNRSTQPVDVEHRRSTTLPSRPFGLSAEEKLVAWRQSMQNKPSGLQSRRSLKLSSQHTGENKSVGEFPTRPI